MKTGKRILSILLTALMVALSLATAAQADADPCAGGHDWSGWRQSQAATCDSPGSQERVCNRCYTRETQTIPALGHSWNGGAVTAQPSCTSGGTRVYTCTRCGATRAEGIGALGHSYGGVQVTKPSTCASMGESFQVCSRCGDRVTHVMPKNENHSWDEGVITREPEGFTPGEKTYTCTLCGATRTEEVEPVTGLFSNLNSLLSGGNLRNNIMSNPLGDDILHIVEQPQGGSIPHGGYTVLHVAAEGGVEPYTYEWWYEPTGLLGAGVSPSALADLVNGQGQAAAATIQQNRNDVKNATIVSTAEWLSKHISNADTTTQHTDMTAMETEPPETKPFNPLAKCMGSSASPECSAWTAGSYWCIVYDSAGHHVTSNQAKVTDALYIAVQPESKNIFGTGSATLTCRAGGGSGNYFYTWYDEQLLPVSDEAAFHADQLGTYYCTVADYDTLEVIDSDKVQIYSDEQELKPVIIEQPSDVRLEYQEEGEYSAVFTCEAISPVTGDDSNLDYEWEIYDKAKGWRYAGLTYKRLSFSSVQLGTTCRCKVIDRTTDEYVYSDVVSVFQRLSAGETRLIFKSNQRAFSFDFVGGKAPYTVQIYAGLHDTDSNLHYVLFQKMICESLEQIHPFIAFLPETEYYIVELGDSDSSFFNKQTAQISYFVTVTDADGFVCGSEVISVNRESLANLVQGE